MNIISWENLVQIILFHTIDVVLLLYTESIMSLEARKG